MEACFEGPLKLWIPPARPTSTAGLLFSRARLQAPTARGSPSRDAPSQDLDRPSSTSQTDHFEIASRDVAHDQRPKTIAVKILLTDGPASLILHLNRKPSSTVHRRMAATRSRTYVARASEGPLCANASNDHTRKRFTSDRLDALPKVFFEVRTIRRVPGLIRGNMPHPLGPEPGEDRDEDCGYQARCRDKHRCCRRHGLEARN